MIFHSLLVQNKNRSKPFAMNILGVILLLCVTYSLAAGKPATQVNTYDGHQIWRVVPPSDFVLKLLKELGEIHQLDFWKDPVAIGRPIDFRVAPDQMSQVKQSLESHGINDYTVFITDIQKLIDEQKAASQTPESRTMRASVKSVANFDYSVYHRAEQVYEWMDMVADEHSDIATKRQFGVTYEGRPLYVLEFKKRISPNPKPIIFVDALIHCREWITTASLLFIFKEMLRNPAYAHMMDAADWYFVPMINVDGYVETWNGDRLWRKTRSTGPSSVCLGTDGNRNWGAFWSMPGASPNPCSYTYYGPTPFSESETRHLSDYAMSFGAGNIDAYISTHSYSQLILYPYHHSEVPSPDDKALNETGKLMHDAIYAVHGKEYVYGPGATTIYLSSGTTTDWTYEAAKVVQSHTYELRDTGTYGFLLPADQIIPNGEEYLAGLEAMKNYVVDNFKSSGRTAT